LFNPKEFVLDHPSPTLEEFKLSLDELKEYGE